MLIGTTQACELTGFPVTHAQAIQRVADQMNHVIIFRAVGAHCTLLLEEGYATKGFRIDTKSCDWGPMRGFVCVDPRLSKGGLGKVDFNTAATREALTGAKREDAIGGLAEEDEPEEAVLGRWTAGAMPLVISAARYADLNAGRDSLGGSAALNGHVVGVATDAAQRARFPWRLIPTKVCANVAAYREACVKLPVGGYGIFVDKNRAVPFKQLLPGMPDGAGIRVSGYDALLGLINPGTQAYGYRACVTGDYDLFAVWPKKEGLERGHPRPSVNEINTRRNRMGLADDKFEASPDWDERTVSAFRGRENAHHYQHYQLGNITRRIRLVKVMLNTVLQSGDSGKYTGGMMVHHSDEIGNPSPGLRKSLDESFPLIAFIPRCVPHGLRNKPEFKEFVTKCGGMGFYLDLRDEWRDDPDIVADRNLL